ncbi:MAG: carbon monoxide dehydrogenase [Blastopirellula sp.]|nr:MAG: carbon monoxide dehydrogenase [Blastopirellula sp.]
MQDFDYMAPGSVDEAVAYLAEYGERASVLAGGTDVIVQLREGLKQAELVVDIKKIPELNELSWTADGGLYLGACTPCFKIYENAELLQKFPGLADAARIIGGWQIQSRASIGGNLCNSSPAADSVPALIAYDAMAEIAGPTGRRNIPVAEFCTGPGKNVLQTGDLLVAIVLPGEPAKTGCAYQRFIPRNEMDIAVVGVASFVELDDSGNISKARIAMGAVGPTVIQARKAASHLIGKQPSEELFAEAGKLAAEEATPISDMRGTVEFRKNLATVLTKRTLAIAIERATANNG